MSICEIGEQIGPLKPGVKVKFNCFFKKDIFGRFFNYRFRVDKLNCHNYFLQHKYSFLTRYTGPSQFLVLKKKPIALLKPIKK